MKFDPHIHHRQSIRLRNYDYAQRGAYFVTICTHNRECLFGAVTDGAMNMNDAGRMIERWWRELPNKYPKVEMDASIVMPNHFHGIVAIVGAALCGRQGDDIIDSGQPHRVAPTNANEIHGVGAALRGRPPGQPHGVAPTLGAMIDWFKTMTTNEYIRGVKQHQWSPYAGRFWQRNYYEHIIRDEQDLTAVREYIVSNPAGWDRDDYHPPIAEPVDQ